MEDDPDLFMVLDQQDLNGYLERGRAAQEEFGRSGPVRLEIGCRLHQESGVRVKYETGLLMFTCHECGKKVCLVQVAEESELRRKMV